MLRDADDSNLIGLSRYLCERILESDPNNPQILTNYARHEISLGQYKAAKEALDRAEKNVSPEKLKFIYAQRGHLLENMGKFIEAEQLFLKAHDLDQTDATFLIFAASAAFREGEIERAEIHARKATLCKEGSIDEAFFNLGGYLLSQRKYVEAKECYKKVLKIDPNYEFAKERLEDVSNILKVSPNKRV